VLGRYVSKRRTGCANQRPSGSVRGAPGNRCPYRDRQVTIQTALKWLCLTLAAILIASPACRRNNEVTYRIILPDQYVGWVRVGFEVKTPPTVDARNVVTLSVGKDGRCQTTSLMVYSVPTNYGFFYDTPSGLRPIRDDFVDDSTDAGGVTVKSDDPHSGTAWYFLVGPKAYRSQHPASEFTSHSSPLPTPGPLPLQKP